MKKKVNQDELYKFFLDHNIKLSRISELLGKGNNYGVLSSGFRRISYANGKK